MMSAVTDRVSAADCTSTIGLARHGDCSTAPTRIDALIVDVKFSDTDASRLVAANPGSVKVTLYAWRQIHDRALTRSVGHGGSHFFDERGLAASTVTPGNTAFEASCTAPRWSLTLARKPPGRRDQQTAEGIRFSTCSPQHCRMSRGRPDWAVSL
jgi:hypothetical protein